MSSPPSEGSPVGPRPELSPSEDVAAEQRPELSPSEDVAAEQRPELSPSEDVAAEQRRTSALSDERTARRRPELAPAVVHGRFWRLRRAMFAVLLIVGAVVPWVSVNGLPGVLIDFPGKRFCVFGRVFGAQDNGLLLAFALFVGLLLVATTIVAGRAFCGWVCPQTLLLGFIFRPLERALGKLARAGRDQHSLVERSALVGGGRPPERAPAGRKRKAGGGVAKLAGALLQILNFGVASALAHGMAAYFVGPRNLVGLIFAGPSSNLSAFAWVSAFSLLLYLDMAWFREQLCLFVCPYGRLQSILLDADSLVIGYDVARGEPRGKAGEAGGKAGEAGGKAGEAGGKATPAGRGDCVDCGRCVAVCPTGIDVRSGLQLDCIACTACIDACDGVMARLRRRRGLIRYDSQRGLGGERTRWLRPRVVVFSLLPVVLFSGLLFATARRRDFSANVLRLAGPPFTVDAGVVRNAFRVHIVNQQTVPRTYLIEPEMAPHLSFILPMREVEVAPSSGFFVPLFVTMPADSSAHEMAIAISVRPKDPSNGAAKVLRVTLLGPDR